jgi:hypothetical protein
MAANKTTIAGMGRSYREFHNIEIRGFIMSRSGFL